MRGIAMKKGIVTVMGMMIMAGTIVTQTPWQANK